jgi:hypothetical protein
MRKLFIILCGVILLAGCKKDNDEPAKKDTQRTVVVYISSDNNLSGAAASDINEMKEGAAGIPSDGRLVAFVDLNGSKPFIAEIKNDKRQPVDTLYKYSTDFYASDPNLFSEVLERVAGLCPSKEYGLVLWGHGSGWLVEKDTIAQHRAYGIDETGSGSGGKWMNITQMASALKDLQTKNVMPKLSYIFADCCTMMCVEAAYELKDVTEYMIGSPAEIPGYGAPYNLIVPMLFKSGSNLYRGIIDTYYDYYANFDNLNYVERSRWPYMKDGYSVPLSVIDTKYIGALANMTHDMLERAQGGYPQYPKSPDLSSIAFYCYNTFSYWPVDVMYDMRAIMERLLSAADFTTWDSTYQQAVPYYRMSMKWMTEFQEQYRAFDTFDKNLKYGCVSMFTPREGQGYSYGALPLNQTVQNFAWSRIIDWTRFGWE